MLDKETRTAEFLAKNPNGRVPVLEAEPGKVLAESNAILFYLADGTRLFPSDRWTRAQAMQWMCFEQYSHEPYIATSRFYLHYLGKPEEYAEALAQKKAPGEAALGVMEQHLAQHDFFAGGQYGIADIALYAYTHVAPEGGFALTPYPAIGRWLELVRNQPGYVPLRTEIAWREGRPGR